MSESPDPNLPHEAASAAPLVLPPSSHDVESDIADEIGDHLSLSARDLQLAGHPVDVAHQLAAKKFGDVTTIRRRLWWIQKGDEVMLRIGFAILMTVVILAVAGLSIGGWKMSQTLDEVGESLAALRESHSSLIPSQVHNVKVPEITGFCYLGDRSRPAKNVEVQIYGLPKQELMRRVLTNEHGKFDSGYLQTGTYTVIAPLQGSANPLYPYSGGLVPMYRVQSGLVDVHAESPPVPIELEIQMISVGELEFELANSFPDQIEHESYLVDVKMALAIPNGIPSLPIGDPIRHQEGVEIQTIGVFPRRIDDVHRFDAKDFRQPANSPHVAPLPAGRYKLGAYVVVETEGRLSGWRYHRTFDPRLEVLESDGALIDVEIKSGQRAQMRITAPDGLESAYREALEKVHKLNNAPHKENEERATQREADKALDQIYNHRPAKVELVGYVPMDADGSKKAAEE